MEKTKYEDPKAVFETENYRIDLVTLGGQMAQQLPITEMAKRYAVSHKEHKVIAAVVEHLPGAIGIANKLQEELDQALSAVHTLRPPVLS